MNGPDQTNKPDQDSQNGKTFLVILCVFAATVLIVCVFALKSWAGMLAPAAEGVVVAVVSVSILVAAYFAIRALKIKNRIPPVIIGFALGLFFVAILYKATGFGRLAISTSTVSAIFTEPCEQGVPEPLVVHISYPQTVRKTLPSLDPPPSQLVHVWVSEKQKLACEAVVHVAFSSDAIFYFADREGNRVEPVLHLKPDGKPAAATFVIVWDNRQPDHDDTAVVMKLIAPRSLDPDDVQSTQAKINIEPDGDARVRRILHVLLSDLALPIGLLTFLVGLGWQYTVEENKKDGMCSINRGGRRERGGRSLDGSGGIEYSPAPRRMMSDETRIGSH